MGFKGSVGGKGGDERSLFPPGQEWLNTVHCLTIAINPMKFETFSGWKTCAPFYAFVVSALKSLQRHSRTLNCGHYASLVRSL